MRTMIALLFTCVLAAVLGAPMSVSDRLTKLEQQLKVHELEHRVKALDVERLQADQQVRRYKRYKERPLLQPLQRSSAAAITKNI